MKPPKKFHFKCHFPLAIDQGDIHTNFYPTYKELVQHTRVSARITRIILLSSRLVRAVSQIMVVRFVYFCKVMGVLKFPWN